MKSCTKPKNCSVRLFSVGLTMIIISLVANGQTLIGTVNVTDYDLTNWANPAEKLPYDTVEEAATVAKILISKDGRWEATGKLAFLMSADQSGSYDTSEGGNTKVLLWNRGHQLTITMEENAMSVIRGKSVRATSRTTFLISDGDATEFDAQMRAGKLVLQDDADSPEDSSKPVHRLVVHLHPGQETVLSLKPNAKVKVLLTELPVGQSIFTLTTESSEIIPLEFKDWNARFRLAKNMPLELKISGKGGGTSNDFEFENGSDRATPVLRARLEPPAVESDSKETEITQAVEDSVVTPAKQNEQSDNRIDVISYGKSSFRIPSPEGHSKIDLTERSDRNILIRELVPQTMDLLAYFVRQGYENIGNSGISSYFMLAIYSQQRTRSVSKNEFLLMKSGFRQQLTKSPLLNSAQSIAFTLEQPIQESNKLIATSGPAEATEVFQDDESVCAMFSAQSSAAIGTYQKIARMLNTTCLVLIRDKVFSVYGYTENKSDEDAVRVKEQTITWVEALRRENQ